VPHIASAKKRLRQDARRRLRNKSVKTHLKTRVKKFNAAIDEANVEGAKEQALLLQKSFDKAVTHGVVHKKQASRKKSIAALKLNALLRAAQG
jgi:small subunit ribosomal protein S20